MQLKKVKNGNETSYDIEACLDKLSGIAANAEVNQEAFSNVAVKTTTGTTTIEADAKKDTLTIEAGNNITLTPDAVNDKITIAAKDTVYNDTDIKNRMSAVEGKLNGSGSVTFSNVTTTGLTTKGEVEIYGATPHIDFHYGNSTEDKTSRIIETASGKIDIQANSGLFNNGEKVALKSDLATSNIELEIVEVEKTDSNGNKYKVKRLKDNLAYTAKYVPVIPAVFVRIFGTINDDMNTGYDYDILNIKTNGPNWRTALSTKGSKQFMAEAKSKVISIRPFESGIKGYDIYIAGFWFV